MKKKEPKTYTQAKVELLQAADELAQYHFSPLHGFDEISPGGLAILRFKRAAVDYRRALRKECRDKCGLGYIRMRNRIQIVEAQS